jgi:hypothetical protein
LSESYEAVRGFGCITYTRWAANSIIASDCRVIPGYSNGGIPVMISLALSLALASSGICN